MKIALLMNDNSYVGRQFLVELKNNNISVDVIIIGEHPVHSEIEDERCGFMWNPPLVSDIGIDDDMMYHFCSLKDENLIRLLDEKKYDIAIQGGTGILTNGVISRFRLGILNFHPGDLPAYRGCSAPEWQLLESNPVICTCHVIDEGIDTGPIYKKKQIFPADIKNYHKMRANLYLGIACFVTEVLKEIDDSFLNECTPQDETCARYLNYVGYENIEKLIKLMDK